MSLAAALGKMAGQNLAGNAGAASGQSGHNGGAANVPRLMDGGGVRAAPPKPVPKPMSPMRPVAKPVNPGPAAKPPAGATPPGTPRPAPQATPNQQALGMLESNPQLASQVMARLGPMAPLALLGMHDNPGQAFQTLFNPNFGATAPRSSAAPAVPEPTVPQPPTTQSNPVADWTRRAFSGYELGRNAWTLARAARMATAGASPLTAFLPYGLEGLWYGAGWSPSAEEFTQQTSYDPSKGVMDGIVDPMLNASDNPVRSGFRLSKAVGPLSLLPPAVNPWASESLPGAVNSAAAGAWKNRGTFDEALQRYQARNADLIRQRKMESGLWQPNPTTGELEYVGETG